MFCEKKRGGEGGEGRVVETQINKMTNSETNLNLLRPAQRPILNLICFTNIAGAGKITDNISLYLSLIFTSLNIYSRFYVLISQDISGYQTQVENMLENTPDKTAVVSSSRVVPHPAPLVKAKKPTQELISQNT